MTQAVHIRRLKAQYRLHASQAAEKRRLDSVLRRAAEEMLEFALEQAGVRGSEIICIRTLSVALSLRRSRTDYALAAEWAAMIARAIMQGATESLTSVHYLSRRLALIDMGANIAQGRLDRVWAWRQIGFWQGHDSPADVSKAAQEFVAALHREPQAAVAVLAALAARGLLRGLAPYLEKAWRPLAVAVLEAAAVNTVATGWQAAPPNNFFLEAHQTEPESLPEPTLTLRHARRAFDHSAILRDLGIARFPEPAAKSLALLALLECEPALTRIDARHLLAAANEVCDMAFRRISTTLKSSDDFPRRTLSSRTRPEAKAKALPLKPAGPAGAQQAAAGERPPEEFSFKIESQGPLRSQGLTGFGGLVFLLHIVGGLKIPERAMASEAIAARGLGWFQHRLALALQPMAPDDPAALAFSGLGPQAEPPSRCQPPPSPEEQELIAALAAEVQGALVQSFAEPVGEPDKLMPFICRRQAQVVADPGWLEIRFSLQDVSVGIRRSGLDIDPGYLPWLGVVVKFVYE